MPDTVLMATPFCEATTGDDAKFIADAAEKLCAYPTRYYTGHCTGQERYKLLKNIMGDRVRSIASGDVIIL